MTSREVARKAAAAAVAARAKRIENLACGAGLFIGGFIGTLFAGPRINDWGWGWAFAIVAVCALGAMVFAILITGWLIGNLAGGDVADYGDSDADAGGGDGGDS
jgi:MFS family permease